MSEVQIHYLRRNWFEAEKRLKRMIRRNPRDIDARLMLASVLRRSDRARDAALQLDRIERIDGIDRWRWEIDRERRFLNDVTPFDKPAAAEEDGDDLEKAEEVFTSPTLKDGLGGPKKADGGFVNPAA